MSLPTGRNHQTAVVIDVRGGATPAFTNRFRRLLESVNGDNIKADVFTLRASSSLAGPALVKGDPDSVVAPAAAEASIDLVAWAKAQGFTQLVTVTGLK